MQMKVYFNKHFLTPLCVTGFAQISFFRKKKFNETLFRLVIIIKYKKLTTGLYQIHV